MENDIEKTNPTAHPGARFSFSLSSLFLCFPPACWSKHFKSSRSYGVLCLTRETPGVYTSLSLCNCALAFT